MKTQLINSGLIIIVAVTLSACVVAPRHGYLVSGAVMPTYVEGQYVGTQPDSYYETEVVAATPSVVYQESYSPYYYSPYYYNPGYVDPWAGVGVGTGLGIGLSYNRGWGGHHYRGSDHRHRDWRPADRGGNRSGDRGGNRSGNRSVVRPGNWYR